MLSKRNTLNPKAALKTCRGKPVPGGHAQGAHAQVGIVKVADGEVCHGPPGDLAERHSEGDLVHRPDTQGATRRSSNQSHTHGSGIP